MTVLPEHTQHAYDSTFRRERYPKRDTRAEAWKEDRTSGRTFGTGFLEADNTLGVTKNSTATVWVQGSTAVAPREGKACQEHRAKARYLS